MSPRFARLVLTTFATVAALCACTVVSQEPTQYRTTPRHAREEASASLISDIGAALKFFDRLATLVNRAAIDKPTVTGEGATTMLARIFAETGLGRRASAAVTGPFRYRFESRVSETYVGPDAAIYLDVLGSEAEAGTQSFSAIVVAVESKDLVSDAVRSESFILFERTNDGSFLMNFDEVSRLTKRVRSYDRAVRMIQWEGKLGFKIDGDTTTTSASVLGLKYDDRNVRFTDLNVVSRKGGITKVDMKAKVFDGDESKTLGELVISDTRVDGLEDLERILRANLEKKP